MSASTHLSSASSSFKKENRIKQCVCVSVYYIFFVYSFRTSSLIGSTSGKKCERTVLAGWKAKQGSYYSALKHEGHSQTYFGRVFIPRGLAVCSRFHSVGRFLSHLCSIFALLLFHLRRWSLVCLVHSFLLSRLLFVFCLLWSARLLCAISSRIYCTGNR